MNPIMRIELPPEHGRESRGIEHDATAAVAAVAAPLGDRCGIFFSGILDGRVPDAPDDGFELFVAGATLFKHQGFREEREVRIVGAPGSQRVMERHKEKCSDEKRDRRVKLRRSRFA
jgi:hypothetical protein